MQFCLSAIVAHTKRIRITKYQRWNAFGDARNIHLHTIAPPTKETNAEREWFLQPNQVEWTNARGKKIGSDCNSNVDDNSQDTTNRQKLHINAKRMWLNVSEAASEAATEQIFDLNRCWRCLKLLSKLCCSLSPPPSSLSLRLSYPSALWGFCFFFFFTIDLSFSVILSLHMFGYNVYVFIYFG